MRIQHNIAALNSYRQLTGNNNALSKNLEKLSSGYRINRAGDDAAGLAISEKMRAQIKGLEVAQKNANDGISLVQTAEGALTEVHSMLNRMVELATQSANGTYDDETSRANLQKEVNSLIEEIDRISKATNFNGLNLLDGSMDVAGSVAAPGEKTDIPIIEDVATDPTNEVGEKTVLKKDDIPVKKTSFEVYLHDTKVVGQEGETLSVKIGDNELTLDFKDAPDATGTQLQAGQEVTASDIAAAIKAKFEAAEADGGLGGMIDGQEFTATLLADGTGIKFEQKEDPTSSTEVVNADKVFDVTLNTNGGANPPAATAPTVTDPTAKTVTFTDGTAGATNATAAFDLAGFDVDKAGTVTFTVGGKDYDVEITQAEFDAKGTTALDGVVAAKLVTAMNADAITDAAAGDFTAAATGTAITLTSANQAAVADNTLKTALAADIAAVGKAPAGRAAAPAAAMTVTPANADTITFTDGDGTTTANATFDLDGLDVDQAGTLTLSIGGKDYDIEITADEVNDKATTPIAEVVAGKLVTAMNADPITDAAAGDFTAAATGSAITLTAANANTAVAADPFGAGAKFTAVEKPAAPNPTPNPGTVESIQTGTINVGTGKNVQGAVATPGQLASTTFELTDALVKDGATITIGKDTYTFKVGADSKVADGANVIDLSQYEEGDANLLKAASEGLSQKDNKAFTIGYDDATGKISIHEKAGQTEYTDELKSQAKFDALVYANKPAETTEGKSLTLQVGDTADDFQKVTLNIHDMSSTGLNIKDINIGTQEGASDAIKRIKDAINSVSGVRGDLGAIQNRLEHTINNLGVTTENLTAAESRIRDTDMAEEMMNYTKNNILVQAAQAMLAQANTVPQGVLQLLQ